MSRYIIPTLLSVILTGGVLVYKAGYREPPPEYIAPIEKCYDQVVLKFVWNINKYPGDWSTNEYSINNKKISVWVANGPTMYSISEYQEYIATNKGYDAFDNSCRNLMAETISNFKSKNLLEKM